MEKDTKLIDQFTKECFSELVYLFDELKKEIVSLKNDLLECKQSIEELTVILELINNIPPVEDDNEFNKVEEIKVDKDLN
jgi:hypothetical protein